MIFRPELTTGSVLDPLRRWAAETPDRPAVIWNGGSLSYAELDAKTSVIADGLMQRGVRRGDRVAFILDRGPEAVLLMMGILRCGAAYVPLDASTPASRIRHCLDTAKPSVVVSQAEWWMPSEQHPAAFCTVSELMETPPAIPVWVDVSPDDLAYIIFTSGSTGAPKGVSVRHAGLTNFVKGNQETCIRVEPEDRVFQGFSPASDGHHEEVWPTLQAGAALVVATNKEIYSGEGLAAFLNHHKVTIISCAPTLLSMVENDVPSLRRILFGAENLPAALVKRWWRPDREILNTYGPTEATVGATFSHCLPDQPITIGYPLPNYYCYVVDEQLQPVARGQSGELCISGIGVAEGYFGRPDLTSEKFVSNPLAVPGLHNPVLYRTGDRAVHDEEGRLIWLGRIDSQVKIRGHRIELPEIEARLAECDGIQTGVVVVRRSDTGEDHLEALIVVRPEADFMIGSVLEHLQNTLPPYMVPQVFEEVDRIPRLPSGKVDRGACAALRGRPFRIEREIVPPQTSQERLVADVLSELFPQHEISTTDDFFRDLGGYSLLASQFVSKIRSQAGYESISVLDLYENPTVRGFAALLEAQRDPVEEVHPFHPVSQDLYRRARIWQAAGVLALFGLQGAFWLGPLIAAIFLSAEWGNHDLIALLQAVAVHAASVPLLLLTVVLLKRLVCGKLQEGEYPMWSPVFLRWWFSQRLMGLAPVTLITGTPIAVLYLRMLGAKIGRNVTLESLEIDCPELVEIGDNSVFENSSWIHASEVAHGMLHLRRVRVGEGCSVGVRSGLVGGAAMETGASLRDVTCLRNGQTVPAGEEWMGSAARKAETPVLPPYCRDQQPPQNQWRLYGAAQVLLTAVLAMLESMPFVAVAFTFYNVSDHAGEYLLEPLYAVGLVALAMLQGLLVKWTVLQKQKPGTYRFPGLYWLRVWFAEKHLELMMPYIVPIYDSLFARPWCIALGMRCGPRCEIALPRRMPYDLVSMGSESFLASEVSIGRPFRRNGKVVLQETSVGSRTFLGNDSVVPQGSRVPDEFLLGVLSVCPSPEKTGDEPDQAWLGSPPFPLPKRQIHDQFDPGTTYRPSTRLYVLRMLYESARIILPSLCALAVAVAEIELFVYIWNETSLLTASALLPFTYTAGALTAAVMCRISKQLLIGTYQPTIQPLWSAFVWRTETHSAVLHDFGVPTFMTTLLGTPFLAWYMRFLGADIGPRVFINTTDWTETDLLSIGADAAVNANAPLQAHLFEDRVMKVGAVRVGARSSIGNYTVVLCDSEVKPDVAVGSLSLVMKGETIPSHTSWEGSPAQRHHGALTRVQ